jgi:hypothetical protein
VITGDADASLGLCGDVGDAVREALAPLRREPRPNVDVADADRLGRDPARLRDAALLPELREVVLVANRNAARLDHDDDVLLACPRVVGPVRRTGPDRVAVPDDVLVVHQVWPAGNRSGLERE